MSLLSLIGDAAEQCGLTRPASVVTSLDAQAKQLLRLANREGQELATGDSVGLAFFWSALNTEATFTTVAAEIQGQYATLMPGFRRLLTGTFWNRTLRSEVPPMTPKIWQRIKATSTTTVSPYFRFRGKNLLFTPTPTAGQTIAVEYQSLHWCENAAGTVGYEAWNADTDMPRLPADIMQQGIVWRWKASKNLDYAEDYRSYQTIVLNAMANDGESLRLDASQSPSGSMINAREGSWLS